MPSLILGNSFQIYKPIKPHLSELLFWTFRVTSAVLVLKASAYIFYPTLLQNPDYGPGPATSVYVACYYLNGAAFYLEHVFYYGYAKILSAFIGIETADWPRCICRIFSYTEMWK